MSNWAKPGVQCVCIKSDFGFAGYIDGPQIPVRVPMLNEVLTVKHVMANDRGVFLVFEEIDHYQIATDGERSVGATIDWAVECFRPLLKRPTDISIFKSMLAPTSVREVVQ